MRIKISLLVIFVFLIFFFTSKTSLITVSAVPPPPSIIIKCDINVSYIENNLCNAENCYPKVEKEYTKNQTIYWINSQEIYIIPEKGELVLHNNADNAHYLFTNETLLEFIKRACESTITPVLYYINQEKSFSSDVWIYPYYPQDANEEYIYQIDETWYSVIYPDNSYVSVYYTFEFTALSILFFVFALVTLIIAIFSFVKFRKKKNKLYLIIFLISVIIVLIFSILSYLAGCICLPA